MNIEEIITCCLTTDPKIVPGDYTVIFSNSRSGPLNSGVLMFTESAIPQRTAQSIEYRLVSILNLLLDIRGHLTENPNHLDFQVHLAEDFRDTSQASEDQLVTALQDRGVRHGLAIELVKGEQRLF